MDIAFMLYPGLTALDIIGPYDVLSRIPGSNATFVAEQPGTYYTEQGAAALIASAGFDDVTTPDVVVVPGGFGTRPLMTHEPTLDWLRTVHEHTTWTTSVCTGSLLLGAAGLLEGLDATTHWGSYDLLASTGAHPTSERVVERGKIVTAAGVSAGIDMALRLTSRMCGDDMAKAIQLAIEYDPQPPFDTGSPAKAPAELVELVRAAASALEEETIARMTAGNTSG